MLEQHTERIIAVLTDRTIGRRDVLPFKELISCPIPLGIRSYIQAELARGLQQEFLVNPRFALVDVNAPGMPSVLKGFIRSCALEYSFPRAEFIVLIDQAVHFLGNYLCRPRWTLRHFVFEQADTLSVDAVRERLEYTAEYEYYRRFFEALAAQKGWTEITVTQFVDVLEKIDRQIMRQYSGRELAMLAKPMFDLLLLANPPGIDAIPVKPVTLFFGDKEQVLLKEYVENICRIRGTDELSLADLIGMLDELEVAQQSVDAGAPPAADVPSPGEMTPEEAIPLESPVEIPGGTDREEEPVAPEQEGLPEDNSGVQPDTRPANESAPDIHRDARNLALSLTFSGISDRQTAPKLPALASMITDDQQAFFIKKLFDRDSAYYAGVIDALENTPTWKEASRYLNQFFHMNKLDPYADEVIQFTDVIHQRYNEESSPNT